MMNYNLIASGSKGNSLIVKSNDTFLLFDFGISKKRVNEGLQVFSSNLNKVEAFFLTHTHSDHASNIFNAPKEKIYCGAKKIKNNKNSDLILIDEDKILKDFKPVFIDDIKVTPLPLSHDCRDCKTYGFLIEDKDSKLSYITDTGFIPEKNFDYLINLDYYIFESNHDPKMLYESNRPEYLKNRIISDKGHLSNSDCSYYLANLIGKKTKEVVLSHLSEECNNKEVAIDTFYSVCSSILGYIPDVKLKVSSYDEMIIGGN